jgi:hypothetical protein
MIRGHALHMKYCARDVPLCYLGSRSDYYKSETVFNCPNQNYHSFNHNKTKRKNHLKTKVSAVLKCWTKSQKIIDYAQLIKPNLGKWPRFIKF